jgi:hypothetical protein
MGDPRSPARPCGGAGIVITDGDPGITSMLGRAAPNVPHQLTRSTSLTTSDIGSGKTVCRTGPGTRRRAPPLSDPRCPAIAQACVCSIRGGQRVDRFAEDNEWSPTAQHLRNVGPLLGTWHRVRRSKGPWRMPGRSRSQHSTRVLERVLREVKRRVDSRGTGGHPGDPPSSGAVGLPPNLTPST